MLRVFKRFRRKFFSKESISKYAFYALGEILLVMIGILLALQVNNWNQDRQNKKVEKKLLLELIENLETNEARLENSIKNEKKTARSIVIVVDHLLEKRAYKDTMDYHFGRADFVSDIVISKTAFEAIESKGFDIIFDDDIRKSIIELFDAEYGMLISETVRLENQFWPSSALPLFHKHFRIKLYHEDDRTSRFDAVPVNYEALLKDDIYINMIKHRGSFRYYSANLKAQSLQKTIDLRKQLESYLEI